MNIRASIIDHVELLAEPSAQLRYEESLVDAGHAPTELISMFCDDLFDPKSESFVDAFTREEHKELAHLYGLLAEAAQSEHTSVPQMLKDPIWRRVVQLSQQLNRHLREAR
ncbi:hypothetical protein [Aureliella helgolandensis]|uniref:Hemerythrin-like domain-containing protein n=1 Tax=Aureliella helgolandensis TaxID=2527968 RepID=A0A518GEF6_9BACT|nr:hypothetical protein [Aureliella helgolandensis]QDV26951.1 hypothetical protein Q31a_53310 [Aureliella helgolandensis]QDV26973.1 hypothetical protein Q31a_53530 [Aureliella helgolandensis]